MCSEYQIKTTSKKIEAALGVPVKSSVGETEFEITVKFSSSAPVLKLSKNGLEFTERVFPVSPFPNSRLSGFENQSDGKDESMGDEKQIQRIYEKPRGKLGFNTHPVLVDDGRWFNKRLGLSVPFS